MCVCQVMSRPRPGKNKARHQDCYESSSPGSSGSSSPVLATRRAAALRTGTATAISSPQPPPPPLTSRLMNGVRATRQLRSRVGSSGSGADSPRSLDTPRLRSGSALSSPLRSRQGTSSPGEDISEDSGIRVNRGTYQAMYQDVINIKALLLRLSRVVQESDGENTHDVPQKNGFYNSSSESTGERKGDASHQEMIADLQRQVVFLQSQVEERERTIQEKERTIRSLQTTQPPEPRGQVETCNAATQTERVRPLSTGPILSTQPDTAGGSLVSNTSDSGKQQSSPNTRPVSRLPQWRRSGSPSLDLHKSTIKKQT